MSAHVPSVWPSGLNSGVLFMKLDRLREFSFEKRVIEVVANDHYKSAISGDQDIVNIIFHNNSGSI